jgi:hypothetical protein
VLGLEEQQGLATILAHQFPLQIQVLLEVTTAVLHQVHHFLVGVVVEQTQAQVQVVLRLEVQAGPAGMELQVHHLLHLMGQAVFLLVVVAVAAITQLPLLVVQVAAVAVAGQIQLLRILERLTQEVVAVELEKHHHRMAALAAQVSSSSK